MIHHCPHCEAAGRKAQHHLPGEHTDPPCPECGKRASEMELPTGDFKAQFREDADLDAIPDERITWERGEVVYARAFVEIMARNSPEKQMVPLSVALAVLEPCAHHMARLRDVAAGEGERFAPIMTGGWGAGKTSIIEAIKQIADDFDQECRKIASVGSGTGLKIMRDLVAKNKALEARFPGDMIGGKYHHDAIENKNSKIATLVAERDELRGQRDRALRKRDEALDANNPGSANLLRAIETHCSTCFNKPCSKCSLKGLDIL
jgi:hypothetical protein